MKKYLQINGVLTKEDESEFTEEEHNDFIDKFIELVESQKLLYGGGSGIYTEEELEV